jgi:hypothetical protein
LSETARTERAASARNWISSFALPAPVRPSITRVIEGTAGSAATIAEDLRALVASTRPYLDIQSQAELDRLANALAPAMPAAR